MNRGPLMNRRHALAGMLGLATEAVLSSPALAAINSIYKDAPREVPDAKRDPEAFRTWFFDRERRFIAAVNDPKVRELLESPLDENFDAHEIDKVMQTLLEKWPVAWNEHIKAIHEVDPPLAAWARGGLEKEFPSVALRIDRADRQGGMLGNGTHIRVDGEIMILTAEHMIPGALPYPIWQGRPEDDTMLIRAVDYYASIGTPMPKETPVMSYELASDEQMRGKRIVIAGHDDGVSFRINKKAYISSGLPMTPAMWLWQISHMSPTSENRTLWDTLIKTAGEPIDIRRKRMASMRAGFEKLVAQRPAHFRGGVMFVLPPGESRDDGAGSRPAFRMSGSQSRSAGKVCGVFSMAPDVYLEKKEEGREQLSCYSLGIYKTGIRAAIENYRAWKQSQKVAAKG